MTILEILVAIVVMGIIASVSYSILDSYREQFASIRIDQHNRLDQEFMHWQIHRAFVLSDSIKAAENEVLFFMKSDTMTVGLGPDSLVLVKGNGRHAIALVTAKVESDKTNVRLLSGLSVQFDHNAPQWYFRKEYPANVQLSNLRP